jgi:hypothetical protein
MLMSQTRPNAEVNFKINFILLGNFYNAKSQLNSKVASLSMGDVGVCLQSTVRERIVCLYTL